MLARSWSFGCHRAAVVTVISNGVLGIEHAFQGCLRGAIYALCSADFCPHILLHLHGSVAGYLQTHLASRNYLAKALLGYHIVDTSEISSISTCGVYAVNDST